jgi:3-oxo-5alpha-steroid 4-dehydrogenase
MAELKVGEPLRAPDPDTLQWHEEADLIVIGFGGAGAAAAIQARDNGASVIAVDRFAGGGATAFSGGVFYAGGTRFQRDAGHEDNAEEMYKYLAQEGVIDAVGPRTLRRFCEGSNDDIEWVSGLGVKYGGKAFVDKTNFPPDGYYLYFTGNEKMPAFAAQAKPAPRGHRVAVNGQGGWLYFKTLKEAAFARGVRLIAHAPAHRLVVDNAGAVVGVEVHQLPPAFHERHEKLYKVLHPWRPMNSERSMKAAAAATDLERKEGKALLLRARQGVVIATGGYNHNPELFREHHPLLAKHYHKLLRLGSMGDDGSGIQLGETVGGATEGMSQLGIARTICPPDIFAHGILVNEKGERFFNEAAYAMRIGVGVMEQPNGKAWLILTRDQFWSGLKSSFLTGGNFMIWGLPALINIFFGGTRRGATVEALARKIHVDPAGLKHTVAQFNQMAHSTRADPFGKLPSLLDPLEKAPFYALNFSIDNGYAAAQVMTTGGLAVDGETGMVKRRDGSLVQGLYAAGRAAAGIVSNGFVSGLTIADTVFSGRRAARAATASQGRSPQRDMG